MKRKWLSFLLALACAAALLCAAPALADEGEGQAEWTVMFYMCGSDLESRYGYASENLKEIAECTPYFNFSEHELLPGDWDLVDETDRCGLDGVNVVVETGGCKQWHTEELGMDVDTSALQRWHFLIDLDSEDRDYILDETLPLQSMADPQTLEDFIRWSAANYPAKKYALVLWDHGGGSKSGLFVDELFDNDMMALDELGAALRESGVYMECVLLDACLMANIETACAIGDSARWMVASEEVVGGRGTAVGEWMQQLCYIPEMDGGALGRMICDTTQIEYSRLEDTTAQEILTWSVIDLSQSQRLAEAFDHIFEKLCWVYRNDPLTLINLANNMFAGEAYGTGSDSQQDLGDAFFGESVHMMDPALRREVFSALKDSVVYCVRGAGRSASRGLSFCNAAVLNREEMDVYAHNCPSPHYLALLDAISPWTAPDWVYQSAERLPEIETIDAYRNRVVKFCGADGMPLFDFVGDDSKGWFESNVMRYNLYRVEDTGTVVCLGSMPLELLYWEENDDFHMAYGPKDLTLWPALEGVTCTFDVLSLNRPSWTTLTGNVPMLINGENVYLRCSYSRDHDGGSYVVHGLWDGYDLKTGMFNRNVRSLAQYAGREYSLVYPIYSKDSHAASGSYFNAQPQQMYRSMLMTNEPLYDGDYYIEYVIYDMFMRPMPLDWIEMRIDGGVASYPGSEEWTGEVELTIQEGYFS